MIRLDTRIYSRTYIKVYYLGLPCMKIITSDDENEETINFSQTDTKKFEPKTSTIYNL
jgi:hypothetical protein